MTADVIVGIVSLEMVMAAVGAGLLYASWLAYEDRRYNPDYCDLLSVTGPLLRELGVLVLGVVVGYGFYRLG